MKTKRYRQWAFGALMAIPAMAMAAVSAEEAAELGKSLTPVGAERAGFDFVSISDHYHPWISAQGHSPFVWSVLGALSVATEHIEVGVGVTCPTMRIHPAVVAQAVATSGCLSPQFFFLISNESLK